MGPQASALLYRLLIKKSAEFYGAKEDDQFPEVIVYSIAAPNFINQKKNVPKTLSILKQKVREINKLEISSLSIACNTAHLLIPKLSRVSQTPFTSMIDEVVLTVQKQNIKTVGLLATSTTIKTGLYQKKLEKLKIRVLKPNVYELPQLDTIIERVISETTTTQDREQLVRLVERFQGEGAEGVILGCTELPVIFPDVKGVLVFNSLDVLANTLLRKYYEN